MVNKKVVVRAAAVALFSGAALMTSAADSGFRITGSSVDHNEKTDIVVITDATITGTKGGQVKTDNARFQLPERGRLPHVIFLGKKSSLQYDGQQAVFKPGARFYPEIPAVVSDSILLSEAYFECRNDILYKDGRPAGTKTACSGSYQVSCNGNQVVYYPASDQICPGFE